MYCKNNCSFLTKLKLKILYLIVIFLRIFIQINAVKESKPEVGSSNIKTGGSLINSIPIEVLFFSPPDIPFMILSPTKVF